MHSKIFLGIYFCYFKTYRLIENNLGLWRFYNKEEKQHLVLTAENREAFLTNYYKHRNEYET